MSEPVTAVQPHDQVLLISIQKRALDDAATRQLIEDVMSEAVTRPRVRIVLDMSRVRFAPSVALGGLVQLSKSFRLDGRRLAIIHVDPQVLGSMHVTNLHNILEIHTDLDQMLK